MGVLLNLGMNLFFVNSTPLFLVCPKGFKPSSFGDFESIGSPKLGG